MAREGQLPKRLSVPLPQDCKRRLATGAVLAGVSHTMHWGAITKFERTKMYTKTSWCQGDEALAQGSDYLLFVFELMFLKSSQRENRARAKHKH